MKCTVPLENSEFAQIPPLENISQSLISNIVGSNNYGRLGVWYNLKTLNEASLSLLFEQVTNKLPSLVHHSLNDFVIIGVHFTKAKIK